MRNAKEKSTLSFHPLAIAMVCAAGLAACGGGSGSFGPDKPDEDFSRPPNNPATYDDGVFSDLDDVFKAALDLAYLSHSSLGGAGRFVSDKFEPKDIQSDQSLRRGTWTFGFTRVNTCPEEAMNMQTYFSVKMSSRYQYYDPDAYNRTHNCYAERAALDAGLVFEQDYQRALAENDSVSGNYARLTKDSGEWDEFDVKVKSGYINAVYPLNADDLEEGTELEVTRDKLWSTTYGSNIKVLSYTKGDYTVRASRDTVQLKGQSLLFSEASQIATLGNSSKVIRRAFDIKNYDLKRKRDCPNQGATCGDEVSLYGEGKIGGDASKRRHEFTISENNALTLNRHEAAWPRLTGGKAEVRDRNGASATITYDKDFVTVSQNSFDIPMSWEALCEAYACFE